MAVFACPDCEKSVSEHAPACPHCGCPRATMLQLWQERMAAQPPPAPPPPTWAEQHPGYPPGWDPSQQQQIAQRADNLGCGSAILFVWGAGIIVYFFAVSLKEFERMRDAAKVGHVVGLMFGFALVIGVLAKAARR